jgi:hypothetical protein
MSDILNSLLSADIVSGEFDNTSQWGIFLNGSMVVTAESVNSFAYKEDWPLSTYTVEQGAFQTYDKIHLPYEVRVRFSTGGSLAERSALIDSIDSIDGDYNLYDVVTPEKTYISCNITHVDYDRSNGIAGLLVINVYLWEVNASATPQYNSATPLANTQSPTSTDQTNNGTVQAGPPTAQEQDWLNNGNISNFTPTPTASFAETYPGGA